MYLKEFSRLGECLILGRLSVLAVLR